MRSASGAEAAGASVGPAAGRRRSGDSGVLTAARGILRPLARLPEALAGDHSPGKAESRIPQRFQRPSAIDSFLQRKGPNRLVLREEIDSLLKRTVERYQWVRRLVLTEAAH